MSRPVRAWTGGSARLRVSIPVSRLLRLAAAVVLLCALGPAVASARAGTGSHADRQSVNHTSPGRSASPARSRTRDLQLGSGERSLHGSPAVRRLQRGLRRAGYAPGPVDGRYGPLTAAAVEQFQVNHGLRVDGIVGPATRRVMRARAPLSVGSGETDTRGSAAVVHVQVRLRHLGFRPGPVDGRFGPRTEHAVVAFQRTRHLRVDGIVGPVTERALHVAGRPRPRPVGNAPVRRAPRSHPAPRVHVPSPAPRTPTQRARRAVPAIPSLPGNWILIGLGALGLIVVLLSYVRTRRQVRIARMRANGPDRSVAGGGHRP